MILFIVRKDNMITYNLDFYLLDKEFPALTSWWSEKGLSPHPQRMVKCQTKS